MIKEGKQLEISTIDASQVAKMFLAGAKNLEAQKEWINELNVFPVPDGDTGTNMSMTIMSAAREVSALDNPDMKSLCKAISVPCVVRAVTPVLSYPSFCADLPRVSQNTMKLMS